MVNLNEIVSWCNDQLNIPAMPDFPGAENGLQVANKGQVTRIGAAVDAGVVPFEMAAERGIDFLIVHHGMYWDRPYPLTEHRYDRAAVLIRNNCALYSAHLPLDAHPQLGNNALLARTLGLKPQGNFGDYQGVPIGVYCPWEDTEDALLDRLREHFPNPLAILPKAPRKLSRIGILTGSGSSVIPYLIENEIDLLITGELKQNCFNLLQEAGIQAYVCGHYATEVFGVKALAEKLANQFDLPWEFIDTGCPL